MQDYNIWIPEMGMEESEKKFGVGVRVSIERKMY